MSGVYENEDIVTNTCDVNPTLDKIETALERVIFQSQDPVIVSINGGWGEGKTFFWKDYISRQHANDKVVYVSVFGTGSLKEIRQRVITSVFLRLDKLGENLTKNRWVELYERLRQYSGHLLDQALKKFGLPDGLATQILESQVLNSEWVICFDDIERLPDSISTQEILGYLDELREDFKIKVVVIYNEDQLGGRKAEFESFHEKVIDRHLKFHPDLPAQVHRIFNEIGWLSNINGIYKDMFKWCKVLKLRNIRLLIKLKHYIYEIASVLPDDTDPIFIRNVIHSLLLFTWVRYARYSDKPQVTFEFLRNFSSIVAGLEDDNDVVSIERRAAHALVKEYGYMYTDDFDLVLMNYIESDMLDDKKITQLHLESKEHNSKASLQGRFNGVWRNYLFNTFDENTDELCEELISVIDDYLPYISVFDLDSAMHLLREIERNDLADQIWEKFRGLRAVTLDEVDNIFGHTVHTEEVVELITEVNTRAMEDTRTLAEVLENNKQHKFIVDKDRRRLIQFNAEALADHFMAITGGRPIHELADLANESDKIQNPEEELLQIQTMAREAAEIILQRNNNLINKFRFKQVGLLKTTEQDERTS